MLLQLTKDQIVRAWDSLERIIIKYDLPEKELTSKILEKLLMGSMQLWVIVNEEEITGLTLTVLFNDPVNDNRYLLMYFAHTFKTASNEDYANGIITLRTFARAHGCKQIIAYSTIPHMIKLWQKMGGESSRTILNMDI